MKFFECEFDFSIQQVIFLVRGLSGVCPEEKNPDIN